MYCCVPFSHCFSISSSTTAADGVVIVVTTAGDLAVATAGGLAVATGGLVVGTTAGNLVVTATGSLAAVATSGGRFVVTSCVVRRLTVLSRDAIVVRTVEVSSEVLACCVKTSTLLGELAPSYTSVLAATF